jgi:hypothetical protein
MLVAADDPIKAKSTQSFAAKELKKCDTLVQKKSP